MNKYFVNSLPLLMLLSLGGVNNIIQSATADNETTDLVITMIDTQSINNGEATLIKFGDTEVLIDCGGNGTSNKVRDYLLSGAVDNYLDYVIITHFDADHISRFAPTFSTVGGYFDLASRSNNKIGTLIDGDVNYDTRLDPNDFRFSRPSLEYSKAKEEYLTLGKIDNYYVASQCSSTLEDEPSRKSCLALNKLSSPFEPKDTFRLYAKSDDTSSEYCEMKILYNYYYDHPDKTSSSKNNYSICVAFTYRNKTALFTGDLEEYTTSTSHPLDNQSLNPEYECKVTRTGGESKLLENNKEFFDNHEITFFKAAHHGSKSSNSSRLLDTIKPKYIGISVDACPVGYGVSYSFPTQDALDNMMRWTDRIYMTSKYDPESDSAVPYYGNLIYTIFGSDSLDSFTYSNKSSDATKSIFDSAWFKANRIPKSYIYNLGNDYCLTGDCTYIKNGLTDVLINCGTPNAKSIVNVRSFKASMTSNNIYLNRIDNLCNDHELDYIIFTDTNEHSISEVCNTFVNKKQILKSSHIKSIGAVYLPTSDSTIDKTEILDKLSALFDQNIVHHVNKITNIKLTDQSILSIYPSSSISDVTIPVSYTSNNLTYFHMGNINDPVKTLDTLTPLANSIGHKIDLLQLPCSGYATDNSYLSYIDFINNYCSKDCKLFANCLAGTYNSNYEPIYPNANWIINSEDVDNKKLGYLYTPYRYMLKDGKESNSAEIDNKFSNGDLVGVFANGYYSIRSGENKYSSGKMNKCYISSMYCTNYDAQYRSQVRTKPYSLLDGYEQLKAIYSN